MTLSVAIYVRVSTTKQEAENQLLQLRAYSEKSGYTIFREYVDVCSGKEESRPAYDQMFIDAHKRAFNLVLFWDISRFSRSGTLYTLQKLKELENLGIDWESFQEQYFKSAGQFKDVVLSILATLAKIEREKISERTKAGLQRAALKGRKAGRPKKDPAIFNHYCKYPGCRVKIERLRKLCDKHKKAEMFLQEKGGAEN